MKTSFYAALLATALVPAAALAQGTTAAPTTVPVEQAPAGAATAPADTSGTATTTQAAPAEQAPAAGSTTTTTTQAAPAGQAPATTGASTTSTGTAQASTTSIEGPFVTVPLTGAWRASDLEGKDVYDANNENIGSISDVLVSEQGEVIAVLVGVGGFLGIGQKDVAVSMDALEFGPGATEGLPTEADIQARNAANTTAAVPPGGAAGTADPAAGGTPGTAAGGVAGTTTTGVAEVTTPVVGTDNLPDRVVLNVTREQLESAPAYDDVVDPEVDTSGGAAQGTVETPAGGAGTTMAPAGGATTGAPAQ